MPSFNSFFSNFLLLLLHWGNLFISWFAATTRQLPHFFFHFYGAFVVCQVCISCLKASPPPPGVLQFERPPLQLWLRVSPASVSSSL